MEYDIRRKARKRVKVIKGFYIHAYSYVIMGGFFFFMNMATDPFDMWFFFPMMPWGVGLAFHYLAVFGIPGSRILSREWEEREYERQLDRLESDLGHQEDRYLEYSELTDSEILELRKIQKEGNKYISEDLV